jgi:hypothetical protein
MRQLGVDDEAEIGQVEAAGGDVGGDADPGAAVAQRLQRMGALVLAQLARQRHDGEAALQQIAVQAAHGLAGGAEHHRAGRFEEAQDIDDGALDLMRRDRMARYSMSHAARRARVAMRRASRW